MKRTLLFIAALALMSSVSAQQKATVTESMQTMKTYPFSDPDPVADPSRLIYPYFRFDGFAAQSVDQAWKVVTLENDYIKLTLFPEIGGKIWGAVDKTSGREFIYNNHVVKFRDVAMRGAWTSGGIEFNFGIIGHVPTTSTPVDYITQEKADGSVSCYVSSYELVTRTLWTVEVNLPKDKAYFTTKTTWHNHSSIDQPYYQWMNAGYKAAGNAELCYPGTNYIGHNGDSHPFPLDEQGREISWYEKNDFGSDKSYHVIGKYNDFYGAYWHDDDFGSVHHAEYNDKLGMKIWIWGLSRAGAIWEDLLTDTDGQYIELQSGRMFNQPTTDCGFTPYKHTTFGPQATDQWTEYWYPVKDIKGIAKAGRIGALNVLREDGFLKLYFSPLQQLSTEMKLYDGDKLMHSLPLRCGVLETWKDSIPLNKAVEAGRLKVVIGDNQLVYSEVKEENVTNRPQALPADFDWNSTYGLYWQGDQWMNQKVHDKAETYLLASLKKDPYFLPTLTSLASLYYRQGRYEEALAHCRTALSINTYQGEVNYIYGLCNKALGKAVDAKDGFAVATHSPSVQSAAFEKLAEMYLLEGNWKKAEHHALKSLETNALNLNANHVLMVAYRKMNQPEKAKALIASILKELPLYHVARFESCLWNDLKPEEFNAMIRNELPFETYMELAEWYEGVGCKDEALTLLSFMPEYPIANYKAAYLLHQKGEEAASLAALEKANSQSPQSVFPFRPSTLKALQWAAATRPNWKIDYYQGLVYWANQCKDKALEAFNRCEGADYAPFYLSRAALKSGKERLADILKAEQIELSWRTGIALMNYYVSNNQWQQAVEVGKKYMKKYPSNYSLGLKYANALCENGQYQSSISLLNKLIVLPTEGAYIGHAVYRAAYLYKAMEQLQRKQYKQVLKSVDASKVWPENLGVGKPYDYLIDYRLENYLEAQTVAELGDKAKAESLLAAVAAHQPSAHFESANLLNALALRALGKQADADRMVASWSTDFPEDKVAQWCIAVYKGENAAGLLQSRNDETNTAPWETSFRDSNFNLMIRLF